MKRRLLRHLLVLYQLVLRAVGPGGVPPGQSKRCLQSLQPHAQSRLEGAGRVL